MKTHLRASLSTLTPMAIFTLMSFLAASVSAIDLPQPGPSPIHAAQGILTAHGQWVILSERSLTAARTVAVAPVVVAGSGAWTAMGSRLTTATTTPTAVVTAAVALSQIGHESFGFAGRATAGDRALLRVALHLGALQTARALGDATASKRLAAAVGRDASALSTLTPRVRKAALALGAAGGATTAADVAVGIGELMVLATSASRSRDPRAHGYLAAGLWAGGALLMASLGGDDDYALIATPLALELQKDAAFGGVDRKVAASLRVIASALRKGRKTSASARTEAVQAELQRLLGLSQL